MSNALLLCSKHGKKALDNKEYAGAILTDLSKAFDCLKHDLFIAKIGAHGFSRRSTKIYL